MSLSHLLSRDVSSDPKAGIINQGQPAQTNKHIYAHTHGEVSNVTHAAYAEQEVYDGRAGHD